MSIQKTKVTEEEFKEIQLFQENVGKVARGLGQIALTRLALEKQENFLKEEHEKLLEQEKQLGDKLKEKYGNAQIDLKTGEIVSME